VPAGVTWYSQEQLWDWGYAKGSGVKGIRVPGVGNIFTASQSLFLQSVGNALTTQEAIGAWLSAPAAAKGGIIPRPTMVLAGEAGPEAIIPLHRMGEFGMGDITIHNYVTLDGEVVYRSVQRRSARENMRHGYNLPGVPA
jgi:hypothetical protein